MPEPDIQKSYNRDDDLKPGAPGQPPRMAQEPNGSEGSARNPKTMTDPATGAPLPGTPDPNQAESDERDPHAPS